MTFFLKAGYRVVHVPAAKVIHIGGASFSMVPAKHAAEFYRNMTAFYRRHALRRSIWLTRLLRMLLHVKQALLDLGAGGRSAQSKRERSMIILESLRPSRLVAARQKKPLISVVIPTYRRPNSLKAILTSLKTQSYKNFEVIVVDQNPRKSAVRMPKLRQRVSTVALAKPNRSLAKNCGMARANGDLILFCDDDIVPGPDFLQAHVTAHRGDQVAGVSCRTVEKDLPEIQSKNICRVAWYGKMIAGFQSDVTCFTETLVGGNMSINRAALMNAGYFDSAYAGTSIFEEQDFSERLRAQGWKLLFTNASTVVHNLQSTGNTGVRERHPSEYYHDFHHNEILYFLKNRHHLLLPFVICFCLLRSAKQSRRYGLSFRQGLHMFMGVFDGFKSYYRSLK